jgi:hypothetical protein
VCRAITGRILKIFSAFNLNALDEELLALIAGHSSATAAPGVEGRKMSQPGQTESEKTGITVRQFFHLSLRRRAWHC